MINNSTTPKPCPIFLFSKHEEGWINSFLDSAFFHLNEKTIILTNIKTIRVWVDVAKDVFLSQQYLLII